MYNVVVFIPCELTDCVGIWWKVGRLGYRVKYTNGRARLAGYNKTEDDLDELRTALKEFPGCTLFLSPM